MVDVIVCTGFFYIAHLFLTMGLSLHKVPFVNWTYADGDISNQSDLSKRMSLASNNLRQSLPIFMVFSVLSVVLEIDNLFLAQCWLLLRVVYLIGAAINLYQYKMVRAFIWAPSIIILVSMGLNLLG